MSIVDIEYQATDTQLFVRAASIAEEMSGEHHDQSSADTEHHTSVSGSCQREVWRPEHHEMSSVVEQKATQVCVRAGPFVEVMSAEHHDPSIVDIGYHPLLFGSGSDHGHVLRVAALSVSTLGPEYRSRATRDFWYLAAAFSPLFVESLLPWLRECCSP